MAIPVARPFTAAPTISGARVSVTMAVAMSAAAAISPTQATVSAGPDPIRRISSWPSAVQTNAVKTTAPVSV